MEIKQAIAKGTEFLKNKGIESARMDTEILLSHVLSIPRIQLYVKFDQPMSESEITKSRELLVRRSTGFPIAYIVEQRGFYKEDFSVQPGVLIPRPETEHVVEQALLLSGESGTVYDWGCGSGCIGLSFLSEKTNWKLVAVDDSAIAVETTRLNAGNLGLSDRLEIINCKVEELASREAGGEARPDMILANPPYIDENCPHLQKSVAEFEPKEALISDQNGIGHHLRWATYAAELLKPGGFYISEIGFDQREILLEKLTPLFSEVVFHKDLSGHDRVIVCRKLAN